MELIFFALAPWLLINTWVTILITAASLGAKAHFLFNYAGSIQDFEYWDALLNGIFTLEIGIFSLGALGYRFYAKFLAPLRLIDGRNPIFISIIFCLLATAGIRLVFTLQGPSMLAAYYTLLALLIISVPMLFALSRESRVDRLLGNCSYPFYLLHKFVLALLSLLKLKRNAKFVLAVLLTLALAYVVVRIIEKPLTGLRHQWFRARRLPATRADRLREG